MVEVILGFLVLMVSVPSQGLNKHLSNRRVSSESCQAILSRAIPDTAVRSHFRNYCTRPDTSSAVRDPRFAGCVNHGRAIRSLYQRFVLWPDDQNLCSSVSAVDAIVSEHFQQCLNVFHRFAEAHDLNHVVVGGLCENLQDISYVQENQNAVNVCLESQLRGSHTIGAECGHRPNGMH